MQKREVLEFVQEDISDMSAYSHTAHVCLSFHICFVNCFVIGGNELVDSHLLIFGESQLNFDAFCSKSGIP